jgi:hypothetical protein
MLEQRSAVTGSHLLSRGEWVGGRASVASAGFILFG